MHVRFAVDRIHFAGYELAGSSVYPAGTVTASQIRDVNWIEQRPARRSIYDTPLREVIVVANTPSGYWDDLIEDLRDPGFLRAYVTESLRVETIDRLVNDLDEAREALGLSKAELARAISAEPAVIRRLLSPGHRNPTIGTLTEVAAALGYTVALIPMGDDEREQVAETLRAGVAKDREKLVRTTEARRMRHPVRA